MTYKIPTVFLFRSLGEISLEEVYNTYGIYVLWCGKSQTRPTYIGEGDLLSRFSRHVKKPELYKPFKGYIAITGYQNRKYNKNDAVLAEAILLDCANIIDKYPTKNIKTGKESLIRNIFDKYNIISMKMKGYNPFIHPQNMKKWNKRQLIKIIPDEEYEWSYSVFPWKTRQKIYRAKRY